MPALISRLYNFVNDKNNGIAITASRVDGELNQLTTTMNQALIAQATAPSSPFEGMFWYDTTNKLLKEYRNAEWVIIGITHVSSTAPATTQSGDVWIDKSGAEAVYKVRNLANSAWLTLVQSTATNLIPTGGIIMWSGSIATIPSGWVLCDGTNSTPDLRDKFIVGAKQDSGGIAKTNVSGSLTQTGGEATHTLLVSEVPALSVSIPIYQNANTGGTATIEQGGNTIHGSSPASYATTGGGGAHNTLPPYYALAFIMKT